jgi:hypothetical protein
MARCISRPDGNRHLASEKAFADAAFVDGGLDVAGDVHECAAAGEVEPEFFSMVFHIVDERNSNVR